MEEEVGGFGFEGDVADLIHNQEGYPSESGEFFLQRAVGVRFGESADPF